MSTIYVESRTVRLRVGAFRHQGRGFQSMFEGGCKFEFRCKSLKIKSSLIFCLQFDDWALYKE